jgi:putative phosphoribosyl transferase
MPFADAPLKGPFADRHEAAVELARELAPLRSAAPLVLGLPAGGVPVARAVAGALAAPFGVRCVLKLHVPGQPEIAAGAVAHGARYIVEDVVRDLEISAAYLDVATRELELEIERRIAAYGALHDHDLSGRTVILVDDGISSGASAAASVLSVRRAGARNVIVAAPVATRAGLERLRFADDVVTPFVLRDDCRVGQAYADFTQLCDQDVLGDLLAAPVAHASGR